MVTKYGKDMDFCILCGKDLEEFEMAKSRFIRGGEVYLTCGYGSKHDGDTLEGEVCDDCVSELFQKVLITRKEMYGR